ncbi:zeta toxin family protein [bacterium]|nr:zeta toxin family protein [bacterium]
MRNKLIILAGSSGSGKTTIAQKIAEKFKKSQVQIICLDHFYKPDNILKKMFNNHPNHDHPSSFD